MDFNDKSSLWAAIGGQFAVGAIVAGVVFFGSIAYVGVPYWFGKTVVPTESEQIGFRGVAMGVTKFESEIEQQVADNEYVPYFEEPYPPADGEELMRDIDFYENVQVLGGLTEANFNRLMGAITEWVSPEQGCTYCHADDGNMASDEKYTKVVARRMIQMNWTINDGWGAHVNASGEGVGVTCYTCHRGQNVPEYIWFSSVPHENVGPSAAYQNRGVEQVAYSSLPTDAIERYLVNYEPISVSSYVPREPSEGTASIQHTERTYALMMHFSESLGVNCTYCHNSRAFYDAEQVTPYHSTALLGIAMVQELNNEYLIPLQGEYPDNRLGPLGDAPKAYCATCHQGANQPLLGANMLDQWPELVSPEPVYEEAAATQ
ncbi:photosynthetic reaction center cytochrome c subunit [Rubricella aquisinus]|uniref:Photosynthetic reaction center cytochrome c subunit n=1 Tax=Rubricella aquisinus TaxID=2028108 RepID=A0A840WS85_9RHOB|nr:photosynthetic reaction center cytochrome PufC [Rubricella aquisinus]MBB5514070.1 photosynthetic reaction center cytochrome c subunit [Rubricella aquisinus]